MRKLKTDCQFTLLMAKVPGTKSGRDKIRFLFPLGSLRPHIIMSPSHVTHSYCACVANLL